MPKIDNEFNDGLTGWSNGDFSDGVFKGRKALGVGTHGASTAGLWGEDF